jgi:hypothetical protein
MLGYWISKNNGYEYVRTSFSNPEKYAEIHEQEREKTNKNNNQSEENGNKNIKKSKM